MLGLDEVVSKDSAYRAKVGAHLCLKILSNPYLFCELRLAFERKAG
jgi:hypothetical protein